MKITFLTEENALASEDIYKLFCVVFFQQYLDILYWFCVINNYRKHNSIIFEYEWWKHSTLLLKLLEFNKDLK